MTFLECEFWLNCADLCSSLSMIKMKKFVFFVVITIVILVYYLHNADPCASKIGISWDSGRMGNEFFEYLAARIFAEKFDMTLYVSPFVLGLFRRYFHNFPTPAVDNEWLKKICAIDSTNFTVFSTDYKDLSEVKVNDLTPHFINFYGNCYYDQKSLLGSSKNVLLSFIRVSWSYGRFIVGNNFQKKSRIFERIPVATWFGKEYKRSNYSMDDESEIFRHRRSSYSKARLRTTSKHTIRKIDFGRWKLFQKSYELLQVSWMNCLSLKRDLYLIYVINLVDITIRLNGINVLKGQIFKSSFPNREQRHGLVQSSSDRKRHCICRFDMIILTRWKSIANLENWLP